MTELSLNRWQAAQEHEREFWDGYAQAYTRYPQILLDHLAKLRDVGEYVADEIAAAGARDMLEVGVGPLGIGVLGVLGNGRHITAVDPLPRVELELRDEALERYVRTLRGHVDYRCARGESLPFDGESYDFVCCHNVIDHAHAPRDILQEIHRVLRSGGSLLLTLNTFTYLGRLKFEIRRRFQPDLLIFVCHPHSFVHAAVLKLLFETGYEVVRHEGGRNAIVGRARLSKFLCRKPR